MNAGKENDTNLVEHEYGHTRQLERLGVAKYTIFVALPSVTCNLLDRNGMLPYYYYSSPWEYQADQYGGVSASDRDYDEWTAKASEWYFWAIDRLG